MLIILITLEQRVIIVSWGEDCSGVFDTGYLSICFYDEIAAKYSPLDVAFFPYLVRVACVEGEVFLSSVWTVRMSRVNCTLFRPDTGFSRRA